MTGPIVELSGVSARLGDHLVLDRFDLRLCAGEILAVSGPSGGGKTTLLRVVAGLVEPAAGRVEGRWERLGFCFQDPRLLPWRTALDNVLFVFGRRCVKQDCDRAVQLLGRLGLSSALDVMPHQLSGGMRRRVALARALIVDPDLLLLDEPLAHLDVAWQEEVMVLVRAAAGSGTAVILTTHEPEVTGRVAHRLVQLDGSPVRAATIDMDAAT